MSEVNMKTVAIESDDIDASGNFVKKNLSEIQDKSLLESEHLDNNPELVTKTLNAVKIALEEESYENPNLHEQFKSPFAKEFHSLQALAQKLNITSAIQAEVSQMITAHLLNSDGDLANFYETDQHKIIPLLNLFHLDFQSLPNFDQIQNKVNTKILPMLIELDNDLQRSLYLVEKFHLQEPTKSLIQQKINNLLNEESNNTYKIASFLKDSVNFLGPQSPELAKILITNHYSGSEFVFDHLDFFQNFTLEDAILESAQTSKNVDENLIKKLDSLAPSSLSQDLLQKLKEKNLWLILQYQHLFKDFTLDKNFFTTLDLNNYATIWMITNNLNHINDRILGDDFIQAALQKDKTHQFDVRNSNFLTAILQNQDKFEFQFNEDFIDQILKTNDSNLIKQLTSNLDFFKPHSLRRETAFHLIGQGFVDAIFEHRELFSDLEFNDDLAQYIAAGDKLEKSTLASHLELFPQASLSQKVANELIDAQLLDAVFNNQEKFNFSNKAKNILQILTINNIASDQQKTIYNFFDRQEEKYLTEENTKIIIGIYEGIEDSPSVELHNFSHEILDNILETDNPQESFRQINDIFIKNNLPVAIKIFKVFQILQHGQNLKEKIDLPHSSPNLKEAQTSLDSLKIIVRDLLQIHLDSNNRSLKSYLDNLQQGSQVFSNFTASGELSASNLELLQQESPDNYQTLISTFNRLTTLYNSNILTGLENAPQKVDHILDQRSSPTEVFQQAQILQNLFTNLDQGIGKFLHLAGFHDLNEAINYMEQKREQADQQNREKTQQDFTLALGDIIKGVINPENIRFLESIFQNGSVAKEYLGTSEEAPTDTKSGDATPLDTDVWRVANVTDFRKDADRGAGYGSLKFVLKDRPDRFNLSRDGNGVTSSEYDPQKMELFYTGAIGSEHYGIRTGFSSSEVDYIVLGDDWQKRNQSRVFFEIAMNGFYIPVVNADGKLIFTPEQYDEYRRSFAGLKRFGSEKFSFATDLEHPSDSVQAVIDGHNKEEISLTEGIALTEKRRRLIQDKVGQIMDSLIANLQAQQPEKTSQLSQLFHFKEAMNGDLSAGLELIDTGSTGRFTNQPGEGDFDLILRLDPKTYKDYFSTVVSALYQGLGGEKGSNDNGGAGKLRLINVPIGDELLDVDLTLIKKTGATDFATNNALEERLAQIKTQDEEKYLAVLANIILAKKELKTIGAYKKYLPGSDAKGLGGVGVENWILQSGGSFKQAAQEFLQAAKKSDGSWLSYEEFVDVYHIFDAGRNFFADDDVQTDYAHDNFIGRNLNAAGYQKMLTALPDIIAKL